MSVDQETFDQVARWHRGALKERDEALLEVARLRAWLAKIGDPKRLESDFIKLTRVWVSHALNGERA